ncbi:MAG TPA: nuclear transport factor 2 family protein [Solirubrobacterales bacterium]|nr:nuclear transport factor 2 family protein [Solirubrobacterales bacterium]
MSAAADFAERFAAYWRAPSVDGLDALLAPDVRLEAPLTPTTHDLRSGKRVFARLLRLFPDLTGVVHRWGETEDGVLIEFTLSGTAGGAPVSWDAVDRFVLREDGLATVRVNYFDSVRLIAVLALRPRAWPALLRGRRRV